MSQQSSVKALLAKSTRWTQNVSARNRHGQVVNPLDDDAVCWCLIGALRRCSDGPAAYQEKLQRVLACLPPTYVTVQQWNDAGVRTYADVLQILDLAGL